MASEAPQHHHLATLPTDVLFDIFDQLGIPDIRRLGRTDKAFASFVTDYLARQRYQHARLVTLPKELILKIARYLGTQANRSHFARASHKLYPVVTWYISLHDLRYHRLLEYAASQNLMTMARKMLSLGENIDRQSRDGWTPLCLAAQHGHLEMVTMLLQAGAARYVVRPGDDGRQPLPWPLAEALAARQEDVALLLAQDLDETCVICTHEGDTALQLACRGECINVVQWYLERGSRPGSASANDILQDRNIALFEVIKKGTFYYRSHQRRSHQKFDPSKSQVIKNRDEVIKNSMLDNVYQIVLKLLQHGADPDSPMTMKDPSNPKAGGHTARTVAFRHPDPRICLPLTFGNILGQ